MNFPEISPELAEETGWHLGDGSMNFYKQGKKLKGLYQLKGHFEDDKQHYLGRIKPIFRLLYGLDIKLREMPSTRVFGFQIWNDELIRFKQNLGLPLGKKIDLKIPNVFCTTNKLKIAVIRGIFDADGSINLEKKNNKLYPRVYITTICPILARQIQEIFIELGLRATKYSQLVNHEFNRQREYRITILGEEMLHKFINLICPANSKHIKKYQTFLNSKDL